MAKTLSRTISVTSGGLKHKFARDRHASGDITTHYSAAELGELLDAAEKVTDRGRAQSPTLTVIKQQKEESVGNVQEG